MHNCKLLFHLFGTMLKKTFKSFIVLLFHYSLRIWPRTKICSFPSKWVVKNNATRGQKNKIAIIKRILSCFNTTVGWLISLYSSITVLGSKNCVIFFKALYVQCKCFSVKCFAFLILPQKLKIFTAAGSNKKKFTQKLWQKQKSFV